MKIFTTRQIAEIDKYTIENEPIRDIDLMERASDRMAGWLVKHIPLGKKLKIFAGPGNNGGDALAIARFMADSGYEAEVFLIDFGKGLKGSPEINWQRLEKQNRVSLNIIESDKDIPLTDSSEIIIDGLFGSGLSRPLEGLVSEVVKKINTGDATIISIDIPSGLMGEDNSGNIPEHIIQADYTLTLQFPKISFFFAENEKFVGEWVVLPIGLHPDAIKKTNSSYHLMTRQEIAGILPQRSRFGHKGNMGHALLIAGSYGKMGAAILASRGCLHAGAGLVTTHVPRLGYQIIQTAVPEAMASIDPSDLMFTEFPDLSRFTSVGVGPGLDKKQNTRRALFRLLEQSDRPLVIDADALNILAEHPAWLSEVPENSILTPHPGEFRRLAGASENSYQRLMLQKDFSQKYKVVVVLKGAFTTVATPGGEVYFNPTGNPGMATGGSGDALTGIILGLLVQGLSPEQAARAGVYIHGLAGDIAKNDKSEEALIAGDIVESLGKAFVEIKSSGE